jgi:hypothetical protein
MGHGPRLEGGSSMKRFVGVVLAATAVMGVTGSFVTDARAGAVIEDQKPTPFRTNPVTLASGYVFTSGQVVHPGDYILELKLLPAVQTIHGIIIEELVASFFQVDTTTKALVLRGTEKATITLQNPEPGRKYTLRELGFGPGHAVSLHVEGGALHGVLSGKNAVIHFSLAPARR